MASHIPAITGTIISEIAHPIRTLTRGKLLTAPYHEYSALKDTIKLDRRGF